MKRKFLIIPLIFSLIPLFSCNNSNNDDVKPPIIENEDIYATKIKLNCIENAKEITVGEKLSFKVTYEENVNKIGVKYNVFPQSSGTINEEGIFTSLKATNEVQIVATYIYDETITDSYTFKIKEKEVVNPPTRYIKTIDCIDTRAFYFVGEQYHNLFKNNLKFYITYSDYTKEEISINNLTNVGISLLISPLEHEVANRYYFNTSGNWTVNISFSYLDKNYVNNLKIIVKSAINLDYKVKEINITKKPSCYVGSKFNPTNELNFEVSYEEIKVKELFQYSSNLEGFNFLLVNKNNQEVNLIDQVVEKDIDYLLIIEVSKDPSIRSSVELLTYLTKGFYKLENPTLDVTCLNSSYSPHEGEINVLVVPIEFKNHGGYYDTTKWKEDDLDKVNDYYFGDKEDTPENWNSFKTYYETASFNKVKVNGMVSKIYYEEEYTLKDVNEGNFNLVFTLLKRATDFIKEEYKELDFKKFDLNSDGKFDNIHFITNAPKSVDWGENLWPHMSNTGISGSLTSLETDVYSLSSLSHFDSARTAIHEQGHMFGLDDYYDYTEYSSKDYIGSADMQSLNCFDWNSYSKFLMNWNTPYVIDGTLNETTITLKAASLNGDFLIIPSNVNTFNNSPFDEYFMLELFSPFNNNEDDWYNYYPKEILSYYNIKEGLGDYGVRLYHVDSRLYGFNSNVNDGKEIFNKEELELNEYKNIMIGANNSSDPTSYRSKVPDLFKNHKLLTLIQKEKVDTFGTGLRSLLTSNDLFKENDEFNFNDYKHFLSKNINKYPINSMNNGENFPYKIKFIKMDKESVTIKITKI